MAEKPQVGGHPATEAIKFKLFRTSDIYFASYLCCLDIPLEMTERAKSGNKLFFVFRMPNNEENRLKALYFSGSGTVKARRFVDNIRNLKQMLHV